VRSSVFTVVQDAGVGRRRFVIIHRRPMRPSMKRDSSRLARHVARSFARRARLLAACAAAALLGGAVAAAARETRRSSPAR